MPSLSLAPPASPEERLEDPKSPQTECILFPFGAKPSPNTKLNVSCSTGRREFGLVAAIVEGSFMSESIDAKTEALLQRYGFDAATFETLRGRLKSGEAGAESNRIQGEVKPPEASDITVLPPVGSDARKALEAKGNAAIKAGKVGAIVLAGGMATRFGGVVKAGVEAIDGLTFMDVKFRDLGKAAETAGGRIPLYPMTSFATDAAITELAEKGASELCPVRTFPQFVSLRLSPEGELFRTAEGELSPYAPGHGDLSFALRSSGVLQEFRDAGGEMLFMSNVDNLTATLDPAIIGAHIEAGNPITAEMAPKLPGDKGGAPARVDGVAQIVEAFRFPEDFDQDSIPVFNTNTLVLDAAAIDRDFPLDWFAVTKKVAGAPAIQFEHLVGQLTAFLPSTFLRIERDGLDARFQPVKDPAELERRQQEIGDALRARGIL